MFGLELRNSIKLEQKVVDRREIHSKIRLFDPQITKFCHVYNSWTNLKPLKCQPCSMFRQVGAARTNFIETINVYMIFKGLVLLLLLVHFISAIFATKNIKEREGGNKIRYSFSKKLKLRM